MAWPLRSISARFILAAAGTAVLTFLCLLALVAYQVEQSIERQEVQLEKLSGAKMAATLDADIGLANTRLRFLLEDTQRRLSAIANRTDTVAAVSSRNVVAIWEMLGPAAKQADVDSIVVLDHSGKVIGSSSDTADLIGLDRKIGNLSFAEPVRKLLESNRPDEPETYSALLPVLETGNLVPGERINAVSQIIFVPLFDDFGEISGGLLAQRWLRTHERLLEQLASIGSLGLAVVYDGDIISTAVYEGSYAALKPDPNTNISADKKYVVRCGTPISPVEICAFKPVEELFATQSELTKVAKQEERTLLEALALFGLVATLLFIAISVVISRQITSPLTRITQVVSNVAAGNYEDQVDGKERADEVGDIARAVLSLQASVKERDVLRGKIQSKNEALKQQEVELRDQNMLFDAALNNMSHGLCMFDSERHLIVSNRRYLDLFGLTEEQVVPGMSLADLMKLQHGVCTSQDTGAEDETWTEEWPRNRCSAITDRLSNGRIILTTRQPLEDGGWVAIYDDVTEKERSRERLAHLASHDSLTNLPNRNLLRDYLDTIIQRRNTEGGTFGILCIDLDEFKTVNDALGHPIGDELLRQVARRLLDLTDDSHLVVRLGGDEFAVVTNTLTSGPQLENLAQRILTEIAQPYQIDDHEAVIGASIGISIAHDPALDGDDVFKQADVALYQAKANGRNTYCFFEEEMGTIVSDRRELIMDMRKAIRRGELECYFQPQFRLADESLCGFEALMRWNHPSRGMVPPAEFIPFAEETGMIVELGEWILREACKTASAWPESVSIAVNISARQLKSPEFGATLINTLAATGLTPSRLELEVTESVLLSEDTETMQMLHNAKSLGANISMDDFGTGYSSLSCLRSFPFDKIKIDQSFVRSMLNSKDSESIVRAVVELAQRLNMTTTAEGVDSEELRVLLKSCGCTEVQGYYFGKPCPAQEAEELLLMHFPEERRVASAGY